MWEDCTDLLTEWPIILTDVEGIRVTDLLA